MGRLARRNLFHDKVRFAVTLTGIVFALVLIIIQFGLFLGRPRSRGSGRGHGERTARRGAGLSRKSYIRAPITGVILRKLRHTGESVSTQFDSPVVTMADDSVLRVRLDVDESDVSKLKVGQRAYLTAEAYRDYRFWGTVIRVRGLLGRKTVRTDEPSEHVDTKILETLVELDAGQRLPLGLCVDSFVER